MKKLLAMLLCAVMLLSACAAAESYGVTLKNLYLAENGTPVLDLSGIGLGLEFGSRDDGGDMMISLLADGANMLDLVISGSAEGVLMSMTGVSDVYSVSAEVVESIVNSASQSVNVQVEEDTVQLTDAEKAALAELGERVAAAFSAGLSSQGTAEINGASYEAMALNVSQESLRPIIDDFAKIMDNYSYVLEDTGFESFTQMVQTIDPQVSMSGEMYSGETGGIIDMSLNASVVGGSESGALAVYGEFAQGAGENGFDSYMEITMSAAEESYTLAFELSGAAGTGDWAIPMGTESVDLIAALEDETQMQKLSMEAMSAAMMAVSGMAAANETVAAMIAGMM